MARFFSVFMLAATVVLIGLLSLRVMSGFVIPLFLAALLAVLFHPVNEWFLARAGKRKHLAASLTTASVLTVVLAPATILGALAAGELTTFVVRLEPEDLLRDLIRVRKRLGLDPPDPGAVLAVQRVHQAIDTGLMTWAETEVVAPPADEPPTIGADPRASAEGGGGETRGEGGTEPAEMEPTTDAAAATEEAAGTETPAKPETAVSEGTAGGGDGPATEVAEPAPAAAAPAAAVVKGPGPRVMASLGPMRASLNELSAYWKAADGVERPAAPEGAEGAIAALDGLIDQVESAAIEPVRADLMFRARLTDLDQALYGRPAEAWLRRLANPSPEQLVAMRQQVEEWAGPALVQTPQVVGGLLLELGFAAMILVTALYFFLADGPDMVRSLVQLSPLDEPYMNRLIDEFATLSRAIVMATLLSAVTQGLLAGVGYFLAGLDSVFLLMVLTTVCALVPVVGAGVVWIPCCLWLLVGEQNVVAAGLLFAYGFFVVSMADNVVKPWVLKGASNLHPLLALLSILGGAQALGPIGLIVGPMSVAFLQVSMKMLRKELDDLKGRVEPTGRVEGAVEGVGGGKSPAPTVEGTAGSGVARSA